MAQPAHSQDDTYSCTICHSDRKVEYEGGIHIQRGISCVDCHGGDPRDMTEGAHARGTGFKGNLKDDKPPFTKVETVELCASCHADEKEMLQYGIPSDQLRLYKISRHGIGLLQRGDTNVAACIDCHGTHRILPPTDPQSTVFIENIPKTCDRCHGDEQLMSRYGLSARVYEDYVGSVHGIALLQKNNRQAPECARCHGVHGATPPDVTAIGNVCGQCHSRTRDYFNQGPHKVAMDQRGIEECESCHGNHAVEPVSEELFDQTCNKCHAEDSGAYRRGQKIKALLVEARGALSDAEELLRQARRMGLEVDGLEQILSDARAEIIRAIPVTHAVSVEAVERLTRAAASTADDVKLEIHEKLEEINLRKYVLFVVWIFVGGMLLMLSLKRRRIRKRLGLDKAA
jgi:hypothetical protein